MSKKKQIITVVGLGYVGLSMATLLSQKSTVYAIDVDNKKLEKIKSKISPIKDEYIEKYLAEKDLDIIVDERSTSAYEKSDFIIVSTPTNYDENTNYFDTSNVEAVLSDICSSKTNATVVIKSTVPVGFTEQISKKFSELNIVFSPEFLRETKALYDNLYPSRIIVGHQDAQKKEAEIFGNLLLDASLKKDVKVLYMRPTEAEAVKLFSNTWLALRVSFFNELDTFAATKNLDAKSIIKGVSEDPRVGRLYNNPSFGYGGYCLPKDTKQLLANYKNIPENLISAIVESNKTRKQYIANEIIKKVKDLENDECMDVTVGIYRLTMKSNSDNFRESSIFDIIDILLKNNINILIYEPLLAIDTFVEAKITHDIDELKTKCSLIVSNRNSKNLQNVKDKVFTRDLFNDN